MLKCSSHEFILYQSWKSLNISIVDLDQRYVTSPPFFVGVGGNCDSRRRVRGDTLAFRNQQFIWRNFHPLQHSSALYHSCLWVMSASSDWQAIIVKCSRDLLLRWTQNLEQPFRGTFRTLYIFVIKVIYICWSRWLKLEWLTGKRHKV